MGRSLVLADFLTDKNGIVATSDKPGHFQIPAELRNASDWGLFQELLAQSEVVISGGAYFKSLAASENHAQDILFQFEIGKGFEKLGQWRLDAGYKKRSPDVAIVTRDLDIKFPEGLTNGSRKILIFTTDAFANSERGRALANANTIIIGSGKTGVDGSRMITTLAEGMGYRVIMMASGPSILELLLAANKLDLLYITQAQLELPVVSPARVQTILSEGKTIDELQGFRLTHEYFQENVVTEAATRISQLFRRYDRKQIRA